MFLLDHNSFFTRAAGAPAAAGRLTGWTVGPWWSGRAYRWGPRWWSCRRLWSPCSACRQTSCPRPTHLRLRLAGENFIIKKHLWWITKTNYNIWFNFTGSKKYIVIKSKEKKGIQLTAFKQIINCTQEVHSTETGILCYYFVQTVYGYIRIQDLIK